MPRPIPRLVAICVILGGLIAMFGTYWDDAWHTDIGRDSFLIPPHLLLYSGVFVVGMAIALWGLQVLLEQHDLRTILQYRPLMLALVGTTVMVASAPIDNFWHTAFGRDAVLWSPPHLLGVAALLTVAAALLLDIQRLPGTSGKIVLIGISMLVLSASLVPVMEYESDVPQFPVIWYLPVLTIGVAFTFAIVHVASRIRWIVTITAVFYTLMRLAIIGGLLLLHRSTPFIMPILIPAVVFDLAMRVRWSALLRAVALAGAVYFTYVPYLNFGLQGFSLSPTDVGFGLFLAIASGWLVLALTTFSSQRRVVHNAAILILLGVLVVIPQTVRAHDPGQGESVGQVQLIATQRDGNVTLVADLLNSSSCESFSPLLVVARRAGETLREPLQPTAPCRFTGQVSALVQGRWFVYIELEYNQVKTEAWIPVVVSNALGQTEKVSELYISTTTSGSIFQIASGVLLYAVVVALLLFTMWIYRHQ